jgi:hypothetical protein
MNLGGLLRRELAERAQEWTREHGLPHCLSYGQSPAVCFERDKDLRHGNFLAVTYRTMLRNPNWRRRLQKVHLQGSKSSQNTRMESGGKLDACTSFDALLMNVFCYPVGYPWLPTAAFPF